MSAWVTRFYNFPPVLRGDSPQLKIALYQNVAMTQLVNFSGAQIELIISKHPGGETLLSQPLTVDDAGKLTGLDYEAIAALGAGSLKLFYKLTCDFGTQVRTPLNGYLSVVNVVQGAQVLSAPDRVTVVSDIEIAVIEVGIQGPPGPGGGPGGAVAWGDITGKPTTFPPESHVHTWSSVTGKPTEFSPADHEHFAADVTDIAAVVRALVAGLLAAGTNITITPSVGGTVLTIAATGGGGSDFVDGPSGPRMTKALSGQQAVEINVTGGDFQHVLKLLRNGNYQFALSEYNGWSVLAVPQALFAHVGPYSAGGYPNTPFGFNASWAYTPRLALGGWFYDYDESIAKRLTPVDGDPSRSVLEFTTMRGGVRRAAAYVSCIGTQLTFLNEANQTVAFTGAIIP